MKHILYAALIFLTVTGAIAKVDIKKLQHTNVILFGATGDLAKRYLWRGLFEQFRSDYSTDRNEYAFYGAARKDADKGREELSKILLSSIQCSDDECRKDKKYFVQATQYVQVKTEKHYKELKELIDGNTISKYAIGTQQHNPEVGRVIYLSIPPSVCAKTAKLVHKYLRPVHNARAWLRLVLEKPFGHDYRSAEKLTKALAEDFEDRELYRIDHYLGKTVSRQILPFRVLNRNTYDRLLSRHHVERVDIAMKEKLDCAGRTSFYDDVGVVRDVMQNHLTELLLLVGMDLPDNSGNITEILANKIKVLKNMRPLSSSSGLIGQYAAYQSQRESNDTLSRAATFGAAVLELHNERWRGVPFVLMSGKRLDEKASYVRISLKRNTFCMKKNDVTCHAPQQIVFHIGGSDVLKPPMIATSQGLPKFKHGAGWQSTEVRSGGLFFGEPLDNMNQAVPDREVDAYVYLIQAVFKGEKHLFTSTDTLMQSWRVWDPLIASMDKTNPRIYEGLDKDPEVLQFHVEQGNKLAFVHQLETAEDITVKDTPVMTQLPPLFGRPVVTGSESEVIQKLADLILKTAQEAVTARGRFHLALSGGSSPVKLFEYMTSQLRSFPWAETHIWQVDERCVADDDDRSNFRLLDAHLLSRVVLPFRNIHPMRAQGFRGLCEEADEPSELYETDMKRLGADPLDFVLLGVGPDGHTASLFPEQGSLDITDRLVAITTGGPMEISAYRISLTLPALNKARNVAVLVTGASKHTMMKKLSQVTQATTALPISMVTNTALTWYADSAATLGKR